MVEWKSVGGYENMYEVSSDGRVRSLDRIVTDKTPAKNPRKRLFKGKEIIGQSVNHMGHLCISLHGESRKREKQLIHRLVAKEFVPNPENKPVVDHIDGNPQNNSVENLRWVRYNENNANTPFTRYLQGLLSENNIQYMNEKEYYDANQSIR